MLRLFLVVYAALVFSYEPWDLVLYCMDIVRAALLVVTAIVLPNPRKGIASSHL